MERLHLRKPGCLQKDLSSVLEMIPEEYHSRIVLHDHFELAHTFSIGGIHLNSRNPNPLDGFTGSISRSCHNLKEVSSSKTDCHYVFLSPIFPSISKEGYGEGFPERELLHATEQGIIDQQVIALGGMDVSTIRQLEHIPFGGVAVLGALWGKIPSSSKNIIHQYKILRSCL